DGIDLMLVDYLLRPGLHVRKPRHAAGIAILTIYACLLLILALSYFRLVYTVTANPGYTPRGPQWHAQKRERRPSRPRQPAPRHVDPEKGNGVLKAPSTPNGGLPASPYAPVSSAYGPINDTVIPSLQEFYMRDVFTCESDGPIYWVFTMIFMAKFVAETRVSQSLRPIQAGPSLLALSIWQALAIYMPNPPLDGRPLPFRTVTYGGQYPLPLDPPNPTPSTPQPGGPMRTFAILHSRPGENIWDLGYFRNFKAVMGEHWYDWIFPIKHSPCGKHDRSDCEFETGPVVERLKREAGILPPNSTGMEEHPRRHRRRRRRRSGHGSGTDGEEGQGEKHRHRRRRKRHGSRDGLPGHEILA
ncbi:MAG: hypothetical protein Q9203_007404, partial [Teloschistes exilis]